MPFLPPNQQCQSTEGNLIIVYRLLKLHCNTSLACTDVLSFQHFSPTISHAKKWIQSRTHNINSISLMTLFPSNLDILLTCTLLHWWQMLVNTFMHKINEHYRYIHWIMECVCWNLSCVILRNDSEEDIISLLSADTYSTHHLHWRRFTYFVRPDNWNRCQQCRWPLAGNVIKLSAVR